jgi:outer membrane receptor protein involved in Fe transport
MRKILLFMLVFVLSATVELLAQAVTTSFLSGTVKDKNGPVPGANIVAVHEPTGTSYGTVTTPEGKFNIVNMRPGGPYKITISFVGYKTQTYSDINLTLAETYILNHTLQEEGTQLEELVVTGVAEKSMNVEKNGAVTNISSRQLLTMPSISRSVNDLLRLTPQGSSMNTGAFGGGNSRQNNFTVDGSDFNNSFGIGGNLPGNNNPVSLDAIEEITVNVTPYDIRQSGFIGSAMNAVTRSGSNTFQGSAYMFMRTQGQQGDRVQDEVRVPTQRLDIKTYGFRLGGPIIKNKLFFFANAETTNQIQPGQTVQAATPATPFGSAPNIARPLASDLDNYSTYLRNNYQYETGPYQGYDFKTTNTKITTRIDWNINSNHRLNVRYMQVENKTPFFASGSRSPFSAFANPRTNTQYGLGYANSNYYQENNLYSLAAELNSSFGGGKFANTFRGTFTNQNEPRTSDSSPFPFVDILDNSQPANGVAYSNPYTFFGSEPFTTGNLRQVKTFQFVDNLSWSSGDHNFTVGAQADITSTKNGFQRFATSYYTYNSWTDFITPGSHPRDFGITYSLLPGYEQAFPTVKTSQYSVYGQDEFTVNDRLKLTVGLRVDKPFFNDTKEIQTHPLVAALTFADGRKIDTGALPESRLLWSPRVGFNFDVKGDRSIVVRGGTGVFTGKIPMVWIVSQSGDAGLIQFTQQVIGTAQTTAAGITFNPDPAAYRPAVQPTPGAAVPSSVSALTKDFRFPQTWKSSLAIDMKLPGGILGTVEGIFNKDLNVARGINPNLVEPVPLNVAGYGDTRPIYPSAVKDKFINPLSGPTATPPSVPVPNGNAAGTGVFNPVVLVNAGQGYYGSVTVRLEKPLAKGLNIMAAYTKSVQKITFDGSGDQLLNTWSLTPIVNNANFPEVSNSAFIVPDRIIASVSYRKEYLKHLATAITLFYEASITGRYSYTYGSDFNNDGQFNDLVYIPKDASEMNFATLTTTAGTWTPAEQIDLFNKFIDQDPYLSKHRGQYAERNGAQLPWRDQLDLKIIQDVFTNIGARNNTLQFTLDIFNFGNFLNKDWGVFKTVNTSSILTVANSAAIVPGGTVAPQFRMATVNNYPITDTFRNVNSYTSTYYMQFGLRYTF